MKSNFRRLVQTGFTLVELLIVVIILAILAAIVIPQFASSTVDAQEAALDANLAALRAATELFRAQHNGNNPGRLAATGAGTPACTGTVGTGAANTNLAWMSHLLMASDAAGNTCSLGDPVTYRFGPYLRKGIPPDPVTGIGAAAAGIVVTSTGAPLAPAAATGGWAVDTRSGQIVMNHNGPDSRGVLYSAH